MEYSRGVRRDVAHEIKIFFRQSISPARFVVLGRLYVDITFSLEGGLTEKSYHNKSPMSDRPAQEALGLLRCAVTTPDGYGFVVSALVQNWIAHM